MLETSRSKLHSESWFLTDSPFTHLEFAQPPPQVTASNRTMNQTSPHNALFNTADSQFSGCLRDNPGEHSYYVCGGPRQGIEALGLWSQTDMGSIPDTYHWIAWSPLTSSNLCYVCNLNNRQQPDSRVRLAGSKSNWSLTSQLLTHSLSRFPYL